MTEEQSQTTIKKISKHEFFFETPLYEPISVKDLEKGIFGGDVDAYSTLNDFDTTYSIEARQIDWGTHEDFYDFLKITLTCKRRGDDILKFFVYQKNGIVIKVGQYPSLADIQFAQISRKYNKSLTEGELFEFKRAIGLAAHGVGVGSFVYLRRIFENLIFETFDNNKEKIIVSEKDFRLKRMEEKIEILKEYLPSQLVEMKSIYSILSKGIHELEEQECLKYFPYLKLSIELILEQKIEIKAKKERDEAVKKAIENINI